MRIALQGNLLDRLRALLGIRPQQRVSTIRPHPPLSGDRDERRFEHQQFEAQTRHVGSSADARLYPVDDTTAGTRVDTGSSTVDPSLRIHESPAGGPYYE